MASVAWSGSRSSQKALRNIVRIRILQLLDSGVDGYPFMPGQVINVSQPPPWMLAYLDGEKAERLPDDSDVPVVAQTEREEVAVAPALPEIAVTKRGKRERTRRD